MSISTYFNKDTGQLTKFIHLKCGRHIIVNYPSKMCCWGFYQIDSIRKETLDFTVLRYGNIKKVKRKIRIYSKEFDEWEDEDYI